MIADWKMQTIAEDTYIYSDLTYRFIIMPRAQNINWSY